MLHVLLTRDLMVLILKNFLISLILVCLREQIPYLQMMREGERRGEGRNERVREGWRREEGRERGREGAREREEMMEGERGRHIDV